MRKKAFGVAAGGGRPGCDSIAELRFPSAPTPLPPIQRGDAPFLLYDSGPSGGRIVIPGAPECVRALGRAQVLGAGGTFKTSPRLRAHVYTAHAHFSGFPTPCAHALLPSKTADTYESTWAEIRANICQEAADADRMVAIDFEAEAVAAAPAAFPRIRCEGCCCHLGKSVYRQAHQLGIKTEYAADAEFQLRAKLLTAASFLPVAEVSAGFDLLETLYAGDEQAPRAYFETNYIGSRVGGSRMRPTFGLELRNVQSRMEAGAMRTDDSAEATRGGLTTGASRGNRPPLYTCVDNLHSKQNGTGNDVADVEIGSAKPWGGGEGDGEPEALGVSDEVIRRYRGAPSPAGRGS